MSEGLEPVSIEQRVFTKGLNTSEGKKNNRNHEQHYTLATTAVGLVARHIRDIAHVDANRR
jgi:hypothetical protein